ncbi:helix-hairpin-helix domain-containing protein [Alkalihalobacillus sp. AL-G]|uniref:helix-hairpin-helix domain-containing protein n=1 Tax=Alkalihalobacillus sp. AL-G TaxID=2926399 RepID=UPI00272D8058|nr:helix-hairpin-helix domain-containing protein [Alkalihalobacillus sp. AL-G]WLD92148.1 helix-hairpin-helix domain-containing protein [Alkalihalobacillus sp. AL-G]
MTIFDSLTEKERLMFGIIVVLTILTLFLGYSYFTEKDRSPTALNKGTIKKETSALETSTPVTDDKTKNPSKVLMVDVKGAVRSPDVYQITNGKRINDVILMAGGFTEDANPNGINLAKLLEDEMVVYVPEIGESGENPAFSQIQEEGGRVNINKADATELQEIPGIGPTKAGAIIRYREEHGPFQSIEDLTNVPGIGEKTLEQMKEKITI